jgi:surfactin synthase thioesterase subunit
MLALAVGVADFAGWASVLAADAVECYYVELPGRGLRQSEPAISHAGKLVDALITELLTHMVRACNVCLHWCVILLHY